MLRLLAFLFIPLFVMATSVNSEGAWKLMFVDSEETIAEDGRAINAFDGNPETFWHTQWETAVPKHPHEIQIDTGSVQEIAGFTYLPRQAMHHGRIKDYAFYVTETAWKDQPTITGTFADTPEMTTVMFSAPVRGRYIRMVALSELAGKDYTTIAELGIVLADPGDIKVFEPGTSVKVIFNPSPDVRATGHNLYLKNLSTQAEVKYNLGTAVEKVFGPEVFNAEIVYEVTVTAYGKVNNKDSESARSNSVRLKMLSEETVVEIKRPTLLQVIKVQ